MLFNDVLDSGATLIFNNQIQGASITWQILLFYLHHSCLNYRCKTQYVGITCLALRALPPTVFYIILQFVLQFSSSLNINIVNIAQLRTSYLSLDDNVNGLPNQHQSRGRKSSRRVPVLADQSAERGGA